MGKCWLVSALALGPNDPGMMGVAIEVVVAETEAEAIGMFVRNNGVDTRHLQVSALDHVVPAPTLDKQVAAFRREVR